MITEQCEEQPAQTTGGDTSECEPAVEELRVAFLAGFTTARTGRYFTDLPGISRRAAETTFEQYYAQRFE